jgi:Ku protein
MAPRPFWHGYLKLSLVTCPVAMLPATSEAEKVRFHTLNRATGNRVHARYVDGETGKPVDDEDQVKGYEREDGEYVMLEDEELDAVALESTRTIDIDCFGPADSIGWIWYDKPHYLVPGRQNRRGGVLGYPRSHGKVEHARDIARRALSPRTGGAAGTARQGHGPLDAAVRRRGP